MKSVVVLGIGIEGGRLRFHPFEAPNQLRNQSVEWVAVLEAGMRRPFIAAAHQLIAEIPRGLRSLTVLIRHMEPPRSGARNDGAASSFLCSASIFRTLMRRQALTNAAGMTFAVVQAVMNQSIAVARVAIRQLPLKDPSQPTAPPKISLIMAHRGKVRHLDCALSYIEKAAHPKMTVRVGLDLDNVAAYRTLMDRYPQVRFFRVSPASTGPYVIRQLLAGSGREPIMAFHDSDDISCFDRFTALAREMAETDCDLIGCHELRFHELDREVTILRFPLDASESLRIGPEHVMLHPSSMVGRKAFFHAGGFSTDRKIANDTQFLLRACFNIRIRNIDGFYYIRRKHANALTVAPATCLDHPVRAELLRVWHRDFAEVKLGRMALEESSLRAIASESTHRLIRVSSEEKAHA